MIDMVVNARETKRKTEEMSRYRIRVENSDNMPNKVRGLDVETGGYSPKQALGGYLAKNNLRYLFDDLWYRFLFEEGISIESANEFTTRERENYTSGVSREGQVYYLAKLFGHARYTRLGTKPGESFMAEEEAKLNEMPDKQVFAIFMKYYEN
jgi:hypothetical protein